MALGSAICYGNAALFAALREIALLATQNRRPHLCAKVPAKCALRGVIKSRLRVPDRTETHKGAAQCAGSAYGKARPRTQPREWPSEGPREGPSEGPLGSSCGAPHGHVMSMLRSLWLCVKYIVLFGIQDSKIHIPAATSEQKPAENVHSQVWKNRGFG